ncbi:MAG TPA: hypothetical protein VKD72_06420, partial [Gemmataceae bacterium]|nr:hypothetical protein [Gemmataceae bacterium]
MARPDELTKERHRIVVEAIRKGHGRHAAARSAGVAERTLMYWLARGRRAEKLAKVPPQERKYLQLLQGVRRADGLAMQSVMDHVLAAMPKSWGAAAWWLRCHHGDLYGDDAYKKAFEIIKAMEKRGGSDHGANPPPTRPPSQTETGG